MACTRYLLLVVALGVLMADLGAHGGVTRNLRYRKRRSLRSDASPEEEPGRARSQLNISDDPSVNVGSSDDSILLDKKDSAGKPSAPGQRKQFIGCKQPSFTDDQSFSSGNPQSFETPARVPQLKAPSDITRTFFPTDPRFGPSTEVVTVGSVPHSAVTDTVIHTRVIQVVSTTTELYFSYLTLTVTTRFPITETPSVTVLGNCMQPTVTRYVRDPTETLTVTLPVSSKLPPITFYLATTSDPIDKIPATKYKGAIQNPKNANGNTQAPSFATPSTIPAETMSGFGYSEPSKKLSHGRPSQEHKVKRSARDFIEDFSRTVLYY